MKRLKQQSVIGLFCLISAIACLITAGGAQLQAQVGAEGVSVALSGKIVSVKGPEMALQSGSGQVAVKLGEKTIIRGEVPVSFSDITTGMYVGATAEKQPDGTFRASRLHIFSEDQRGTGEGHRPLGSAPQTALTMTNANVESVEDVMVNNIRGRMLMLRYKGGEIKVVVPADTLVVKRVTGDRTLLVPGVEVSVNGTRISSGEVTATQVTVRAPAK